MASPYVYNPSTNRFVLKTGPTGMRLLKGGMGSVSPLEIQPLTTTRKVRTIAQLDSFETNELKDIEQALTMLESNQKQIKLLRNKANYIVNELEIFENREAVEDLLNAALPK